MAGGPSGLEVWLGRAVGRSQINGTVAETLNDCSLSGLSTDMIWDLSLYERFSPSEPIRILGCELWMPICSTDDVSSYRFCWIDPFQTTTAAPWGDFTILVSFYQSWWPQGGQPSDRFAMPRMGQSQGPTYVIFQRTATKGFGTCSLGEPI